MTPFVYLSVLISFILASISEEVIYILLPTNYAGSISIISILCMYFSYGIISKVSSIMIIYKKKLI